MPLTCKIGLHTWDGCKCTKCEKIRDEKHTWDGCKCTKCGKIRDEKHTWDGCKCTKCQTTRNEGHLWDGYKCTKCGKSRKDNMDLLFNSVSTGDIHSVECLLAKSKELINVQHDPDNFLKQTLLTLCATRCHCSIAKLLLDMGADVNAQRSKDGWTPLLCACQNGDVNSVKLFLEFGADINIKSVAGATPIHVAAYGLMESTFAILETEFSFRKERPKLDIESVIKLLISHGANINEIDTKGATPIHIAVLRSQTSATRVLLDFGADLTVKYNGQTPLHIAAGQANETIVKMLLEKGADINIVDVNNHTPLEVIGAGLKSIDPAIKSKIETLFNNTLLSE